MKKIIGDKEMEQYKRHMRESERSEATIEKYIRDILKFRQFINQKEVNQELVVLWKEWLMKQNYKMTSINSMLVALNNFFEFQGWRDSRVKLLRIQKESFVKPEKELERNEYIKLVQLAKREGNERLSLIMQTICSTGIRISELPFITCKAVADGVAQVYLKRKVRTIFLPDYLCEILREYIEKMNITEGVVFVTKGNIPVSRTNIWKEMKQLCEKAGIEQSKVFPHNLRHNYSLIWMSCGENRMTFGFSGVFYPQNARKKEAQFHSCHFGDFKAVWDLNPHRKHRYRQKRSTLNPMKQPKLKKKTQVAPFLKWLRMPDSKKWRPFYIKPRKPLLQA